MLQISFKFFGNNIMEMFPYRFRLRPGEHLLQFVDRCAAYFRQRSEVRQEFLRRSGSDTGNLGQFRTQMPPSPPRAVESNGKTMTFITYLLDQTQHRRSSLKDDGFLLPA